MAMQLQEASNFHTMFDRASIAGMFRFKSENVTEVQDYLSSVLVPHKLRSQGQPLDFRHYGASVHNLAFNYIEYGHLDAPIDMNAVDLGDSYVIRLTLAGLCELRRNRRELTLEAGKFIAINPNGPAQTRMHGDYTHFTIKIPGQYLRQTIAVELGFAPSDPVLFDLAPVSLSDNHHGLMSLVRLIWGDLSSSHPQLMTLRTGLHLERALLSSILATFEHNYSSQLHARGKVLLPHYIRKTIKFIEQHASEPLDLPDLVAASGVSTRSLHSSFRRFLATSPMAYLRTHRLNLARRQLSRADENGRSVTDIAFECGFTHLSKFASDFRLRFGVLPSQVRAGLVEGDWSEHPAANA